MGYFKWILPAFGGLLMFGSEISPDVAESNLSAWAKTLHLDDIAEILASPSADSWGMTIGVMLVIIGIVSMFLNRRSKQIKEYSHPVNIEDGLLEKQLTIAWSSVDSSLFDDINGTLVEFQCYSTGDHKYQCLPGMKNITSLKNLKDKTYDIHKLVFTNRGKEPIFKIKVPFILECCVRNGATEKYEYIVHSENSCFFGSVNESIQPGESMTFYLCNGSEKDYLIVVHLQDYVEANLFGKDEQVKIKYTWETFKPLLISLRYIPDYHVHR